MIPRVFHFIWPNKNFTFDGKHKVEEEETHRYVSTLKRLHPGWEMYVWTDDECEELVRVHRPEYMAVWKALTPRLKMWDAIRPLILMKYGGVYIDADVNCRRSFTPIIPPGIKVLLRANWHRTLGYITKFESEKSVASGNHIMGSVPEHPVWEIYLKKIVEVQAEDPHRTVTKHTGNSQLEASVITFLEEYPHLRDTFKLMDLGEFENSGECDRMNKLKFNWFQRAVLGQSACSNLICTHVHALSPVEAAGGDDNAKGQIRKSNAQNLRVNGDGGAEKGPERDGVWYGTLFLLVLSIVVVANRKKFSRTCAR
jgi:mannosyltransferase OCH1-like enzyme